VKIRNPKPETRIPKCGIASGLLLVCSALSALAQVELPKLQPPLGEIPPTFWEQYAVLVIVAAVLLVAVAALGVWLWLRPRPITPVLPEVAARRALEELQRRPEDGAGLSRVSQVLRRYVLAAFELPADETTTAEFCRLIASHERIGPELAEALASFLRDCDQRKFARSQPKAPFGASTRALELLALAETRRAQFRTPESQAVQPAVATA
jgi:hypothetical protein